MDYPGKIIRKTAVTPSQTSASGVWTVDDASSALKNNNWPIAGVPNPISRSLRFNQPDSTYLNRTPGSAGNRKTWTWSAWIKLSTLGTIRHMFFGSSGDLTPGTDYGTTIRFDASNNLEIFDYTNGGFNFDLVTTQVFRDPSSWYHIVVAFDTTQATSTNRVKLYINGSQVTAFGTATYPTQNTDYWINSANLQLIGDLTANGGGGSTTQYFSGYMAEMYFIDGQALTPSSFGMTDPQTGAWIPIKYTGTYGTNGFYLNFKDNSSTGTLGYDYSGNGNNWTANNFSVTAGAGNDSLTDVPTPWIAYNTTGDVGGVVRGNYCTLNPLSTSRTLTNGNLYTEVNGGGGSNIPISATMAIPTTGKWYWEITAGGSAGGGNGGWDWGIVNITVPNFRLNNLIVVGTGGCYGVNGNDGNFRENNTTGIANYISGGISNGDVAMVAYDADNGKLWLGKNGTWGNDGTGNGDPAAGLRPAKTAAGGMTGQFIPVFEYASDSGLVSATANFGQRPFAYTPPAGFLSLCTTNLPTPTIGATSTTQAGKYFNAVAYTGNASGLSVTGVGFQPDLVWAKKRSGTDNNVNSDVLCGVKKELTTNSTAAEVTNNNGLQSFDSDGFTVGSGSGSGVWGGNTGATYVGWCWKANGAGVTNTAGTITSTVSANTTAGFSVVTWTGTGVNGSVGHGLGVTPSMIIIKGRDTTYDWRVWFSTFATADDIQLNTTAAVSNAPTVYRAAPTSTLINIGTGTAVNENTKTYVAYCFAAVAGYSAFGKYVGNGSSDGPFIYTGFRPKWILIRPSDSVDNWQIQDIARSPYNVVNDQLWPNLSDGEQVDSITRLTDFLSNGFKLRGTNPGVNGNAINYIYAAFAEFPFKFSNAR